MNGIVNSLASLENVNNNVTGIEDQVSVRIDRNIDGSKHPVHHIKLDNEVSESSTFLKILDIDLRLKTVI